MKELMGLLITSTLGSSLVNSYPNLYLYD